MCNLSDGGVSYSSGHEVSAALEATAEVGQCAILLVCHGGCGGEGLQQSCTEGGEVCASNEGLGVSGGGHGLHESVERGLLGHFSVCVYCTAPC